MAERQAAGSVFDCSITVPEYFTHHERIALIESASLAGLKVLSLVNQGAAWALKYAIDRDVNATPHHVVFFDLGESSLQLSVVKFFSSINKKNTTVINVLTLATHWDQKLGARDFDSLLLGHLIKRFKVCSDIGRNIFNVLFLT